VPKRGQAYEPKVPVKVREWIGPALASHRYVEMRCGPKEVGPAGPVDGHIHLRRGRGGRPEILHDCTRAGTRGLHPW
jgi:hypothetical protein